MEKAEPVRLGSAGQADVGYYIRHLCACGAFCSRPSHWTGGTCIASRCAGSIPPVGDAAVEDLVIGPRRT